MVQVIAEASADVNRYPDNGASALTEAIAERHNVPPKHIAVGCGSVGVAQQLLGGGRRAGRRGAVRVAVVRGIPELAQLTGATGAGTPRDETHHLAAMADAITPRTRVDLRLQPE